MSAREGSGAPVSWAAATWSVPASVVTWLLVTLLIGLVTADLNENVFYAIAAIIAAAMAAGGGALSRRGGAAVRGAGTGMLYGGIASVLVAIAVVVS